MIASAVHPTPIKSMFCCFPPHSAVPPFEVQVEPRSFGGLINQPLTLTCTATADASVLVDKTFRWERRIIDGAQTELIDNGDTVRIRESDLSSPVSTSELIVNESNPGFFQFVCNATLQFPGVENDISKTDYANVTFTGKTL